MALSYAERAAQVMEHVCSHAAHGYSQPHRAGDGTTETLTLSDGTKVSIHGGDYDCSELVRMCYAAATVLPASSYMWTGNELELLKSRGFHEVAAKSVSQLRRGDVLLKSGHTAMYLGGGKLGEAAISERGTIDGARGDQTGNEVRVRSYYGPWAYILRVDGPTASAPAIVSPAPAAKKAGMAGRYRCAVNWLNVRTGPGTNYQSVDHYTRGNTVNLDGWTEVHGGYLWGRYRGATSGKLRYVAIGRATGKPEKDDYLVRV